MHAGLDDIPCGLRDWSEPHPLLGFPQCRLMPSGGVWASEVQCIGCKYRDPFASWVTHGARPAGKRVVIRSQIDSHTGYGQIADWLGRALAARGLPVAYMPIFATEAFLPLTDQVRGRLIAHSRDPWELLLAPPAAEPDPRKGAVTYTMWETTKLPSGCVDRLNRACAVVLPSGFCAEVFSANGVVVPLYVVPPGISATEYAPQGEPPVDVCRFGTAGRLAHGGRRKGVEDVIAAFRAAFPNEVDAALSVKIWPDCNLPPVDDPRVTIVRTPLSTGELADWYRSLTVYVSASRGEGFGFLPLQAMACGRAAIATAFSGHGEYFDETVGYPLQFRYRPADGMYVGLGHWGVPEPDSLVARMRQVYRNRDEAARLGDAAARRARQFTWDRTAAGLVRTLVDVGALDRTALLPDDEPEQGRSP
ncbi:MAG: glycosyltransferase family 4 protein [Isosphaeraceae bacterium]